MPDQPTPPVKLKCAKCKKEFLPKRFWQKFCSRDCKNSFHAEERAEAIAEFRRQQPDR